MSLYALMLTMDVLLIGMRLSYPFEIGQLLAQMAIAIRETSGWFLLIWLLQLHQHPRLVHYTKLAAIIGIASATIDGSLSFLYPDFISVMQMQIADAITTFPAVTFECIPVASGCLCHFQTEAFGLNPLAGRHPCLSEFHGLRS